MITLGDIKLDEKLYDMLEAAFTVNEVGANYFNPLCGSLTKKWKEVLDKGDPYYNPNFSLDHSDFRLRT